ncbi:MAG: RNA 2',3'-cyclic phosphodiesterase [Gemmatimonadota bacterium]
MRLFAGIPVPEPARGELRGILNGLRALEWPVRWTGNDGLHLTLKFYGSVPGEQVPLISRALADTTRDSAPIPLTCTGMGHFPSGRMVQVIWVGVDAPGALELLQDRVERASNALGFPLEGRPFRPPITLGRVRTGEKLSALDVEKFPAFESISFLAERLVLFESRPGSGGSVYTPRATMEF